MSKRIEMIIGTIYGAWEVMAKYTGKYSWCRCGCGTVRVVGNHSLRKGESGSCGSKDCKYSRRTTRPSGFRQGDRFYQCYKNMKSRCYNPNYVKFERYGGRGIKVCQSWLDDPMNFYYDMKDTYSDELTLDRIDNNEDYSPENCRWATWDDQRNNRNNNCIISAFGITDTKGRICEKFGINRATFSARLKRGWGVEKALTHTVRKISKKNTLT